MCLHHAVQVFAMAEVLISFKEFSFTYKAQSEPTLKHINPKEDHTIHPIGYFKAM